MSGQQPDAGEPPILGPCERLAAQQWSFDPGAAHVPMPPDRRSLAAAQQERDRAARALTDLKRAYPPEIWPFLDPRAYGQLRHAEERLRRAERGVSLVKAGIPAEWPAAATAVFGRIARLESLVAEQGRAIVAMSNEIVALKRSRRASA